MRRRLRTGTVCVSVLTAALSTLAGPAVAAAAQALTITEFGSANGLQDHNYLQHLTLGPDGNVWFTDMGQTTAIGMISPNTDQILEYSTGLPASATLGGITTGPDGKLWFTDAGTPAIGTIDPSSHVITEYSAGLNPGSKPVDIVAGPDGDLWFTDAGTTKAIGYINPTTHSITEISAGLQAGNSSGPLSITAGPDGNIWFTDVGAVSAGIGVVNLSRGDKITEYLAAPSPTNYPGGIVSGPDGDLWFADGDAIGRITPAGAITTYTAGLQSYAQVQYLASGPDGNLWFNDVGGSPSNPELGMIDPTMGAITEFRSGLPASTEPAAITPGPSGTDSLWFADVAAYSIGEIRLAGTSVAGVSVTPSVTGAGASADWTVGFSTSPSGALSVASAVYVAAPTGTMFPSSASAYRLNGTVAGAVYGGGTNAVQVVPSTDIAASTAVSLAVSGVTNPGAGSFPATAFSVWTTADPVASHPSGGLVIGKGGTASPPVVTAVSPDAGPAAGGTSVTISGSGLGAATAVDFGPGNPALNLTVVSDSKITVSSPAGSGVVDVTVTDRAGTSAVNAPGDQFTYIAAPAVTGVTPTEGPTAGGTQVTVSGSGFTGATQVNFGTANPASHVVIQSDTSLTAVTPPGSGTVAVTVTGAGGAGAESLSGGDLYTYVPQPVVTGVSPSAGNAGGGTDVVITGSNLALPTSVDFGAQPAESYRSVSGTEIDAVAPSGAEGATVAITVTTAGGASTPGTAAQYTFVTVPQVTGIQPSEAPVGSQVAITGSGLSGVTGVTFGGVEGPYLVASDGVIYATVPAGSGIVPISVLGPQGVAATLSSGGSSGQFAISRNVTLQLKVVDTSGNPVAGLPLQATDPATGAVVGTATSAADGSATISGQLAGTSVQVTGTVGASMPYYTAQGTTLTVPVASDGTTTAITVQLTPLPTGTLSGVVTDQFGEPCSDCSISVAESVDNRNWTYDTTPDATGAYQVSALAGAAHISAVDWAAGMEGAAVTASVPASGTATANLVITRTAGQLTTQIFTLLDGGSWQGPMPITWRVRSHFDITVTDPSGSTYGVDANATTIDSPPGTPLQVCAGGYIDGLPRTCTTAVVGADYNAVATLRLAQEGHLAGTVAVGGGCASYEIDDAANGSEVAAGGLGVNAGGGDAFDVPLPAGQYQVTVLQESVCSQGLTGVGHAEAQVAASGTTDLGSIATTPVGGAFAGSGNGITANPGGVSAGGVVTLHVDYLNGGKVPAQGAQALLGVPAGTAVVPGSVAVNGSPVATAPAPGGVAVPLGDVAAQASGTIRYQLAFGASLTQPLVTVGAEISYTAGGALETDPMGTTAVTLYSNQVTLAASAETATPTITVSGRAAPGSTVGVYDADLLLGQTQAEQGRWVLQVTLPGAASVTGSTATVYDLHAQATDSAGTYDSGDVAVRFDPGAPQLLQVCLSQSVPLNGGGDSVCTDPRQAGELNPPYVFVPGYPLTVGFTFSDPSRISDVVAIQQGSGANEAQATQGPDGSFEAVLPPLTGDPGTISWQYWVKPAAITVPGGTAALAPPSLAQLQQLLPPALQDFVVEGASVSADGTTGSLTLGFPDLGNTQITMTFTRKSNVPYSVTAQDTAQAAASGVPVYGFAAQTPWGGPSDTTWSIQGYVPPDVMASGANSLPPGDPPMDFIQVAMAFKSLGWHAFGTFLDDDVEHSLVPPVNTVFNVSSLWSAVVGNANQQMTQLAQIQRAVNGCLAGGGLGVSAMAAQGDLTRADILGNLLWYDAMELASVVVAAPEYAVIKDFPGLTGLLNTIAFNVDANQLAAYDAFGVQQDMDKYMSQAVRVLQAESSNERQGAGKCSVPGGAETIGAPGPVAPSSGMAYIGPMGSLTPAYTEDPSGYVYEGAAADRVQGATVTALQQDPATGAWSVWNAQPYGQENNETTDSQGRYGWDVPFGNWKVTVQKPGYATATSDSVTVPPPQYNVNVGLVSLSPPVVSSAFAATGGRFVQVDFSQLVLAATLTGANITVSTAGGAPVSGTVQPLDPVEAPNGVLLAQAAQFVPRTPLAPGQTYTVSVSQAVANYAGHPLAAPASESVTVPDAPASVAIAPSSASGVADGHTGVTLTARVTDAAGQAVPGASVTFATTFGNLSVTEAVYTGATGTASAVLTASAGGSAFASAQVPGLPAAQTQVTFALPAPVATTVTVAASSATVPSGGQSSVTATVLDQYGKPMPNVPVTFSSTAGSLADTGTLETDASGEVSTTLTGRDFTGSPATGQATVTASVGGSATNGSVDVAFATPTPVATSESIAGSAVTAPSDGRTAVTISIIVDDQFGNPMAGVPVTFTTSLGALTPQAGVVTDSLGAATVALTSSVPGLAVVEAQVAGITAGNTAQVQFGSLLTSAPTPTSGASVAGTAPLTAVAVGTQGGILETADGLFRMALAPGSIASGAISVQESQSPLADVVPATVVASPVFTLTGTAPIAPQVAVIRYAVTALQGLSAERLSVYREGAGGTWQFVPTAVNMASGTVSVHVAGPETLVVLAATTRFSDVAVDNWAASSIDQALAAGVVAGFPGGRFQPDGPLTRAQFVKMLDLVLGLQAGRGTGGFSDVAASDWFAPYVVAAVQAGLVEGLTPTTFGPNDTVSREQMAVLLARAFKLAGSSQLTFSDANEINSYARAPVAAAVSAGYLSGFPDGTLQPLGATTRAQAAKVIALAIAHMSPSGE